MKRSRAGQRIAMMKLAVGETDWTDLDFCLLRPGGASRPRRVPLFGLCLFTPPAQHALPFLQALLLPLLVILTPSHPPSLPLLPFPQNRKNHGSPPALQHHALLLLLSHGRRAGELPPALGQHGRLHPQHCGHLRDWHHGDHWEDQQRR